MRILIQNRGFFTYYPWECYLFDYFCLPLALLLYGCGRQKGSLLPYF